TCQASPGRGFEHSFATDAIRRGVPERFLQRFLGNALAESTRRDARLADGRGRRRWPRGPRAPSIRTWRCGRAARAAPRAARWVGGERKQGVLRGEVEGEKLRNLQTPPRVAWAPETCPISGARLEMEGRSATVGQRAKAGVLSARAEKAGATAGGLGPRVI